MMLLTGAPQTGETTTFRRFFPNLHEDVEILTIDIRLIFA